MNIAERQIVRQIEGSTLIKVFFVDSEPGYMYLTEQDGKSWLQPAFCKEKRLSQQAATEIRGMFTGEQEFNTDPDVVRSGMTYDEFFDKYYNHIEDE